MNIGTVSDKSGLPAKTIRYYDDIGLISPDRRDNGYLCQMSSGAEPRGVFRTQTRESEYEQDDRQVSPDVRSFTVRMDLKHETSRPSE
jgi:hypothetical protein